MISNLDLRRYSTFIIVFFFGLIIGLALAKKNDLNTESSNDKTGQSLSKELDLSVNSNQKNISINWKDDTNFFTDYISCDLNNNLRECSSLISRSLETIAEKRDILDNADINKTYLIKVNNLLVSNLSKELKISRDSVKILNQVYRLWPNACLGMPGNNAEDSLCAEVITPGFQIELEANRKIFIYRTNLDGSIIKLLE